MRIMAWQWLLAGFFLAALLWVGGGAFADGQPGMQTMTITRLDWAVVEFSNRVSGAMLDRFSVAVYCSKAKPPDTITCHIVRNKDATQEQVVTAAHTTKAIFNDYRNGRGFTWLRLDLALPEPLPQYNR